MVQKRLFRLIVASFLGIILLLLGSFWAYHRSSLWLTQQLTTLHAACARYNVTLVLPPVEHTGWPWGSSFHLNISQFRYEHTNTQLGGAATSVEFGGNWLSWLWYGFKGTMPPLHLPGPSIIRFVHDGETTTIHVQDLTLTPSFDERRPSPVILTFHSALVTASSDRLPYPLQLAPLSGRFLLNLQAGQDETRLGLTMTVGTTTLNGAPFPFNLPLHHLHMTAAIPGAQTSLVTSLKEGLPLRLHDVSVDFPPPHSPTGSETSSPPPHLSLGGTIHLPDGNGLVTLQLTHWRLGMYSLLDLPVFRQLSPEATQALQRYVAVVPPHTVHEERPLMVSIPLSEGHFAGLTPEKAHTLYQMILQSQHTHR